jgi:hypothetical protein
MVKESKAKMECKVLEIKTLGTEGGAGNLIICEILKLHIDDSLLDENKKMDQRKINHIARLGADWYCVVTPENLFEVEKPNTKLGVGIDALPPSVRNSAVLSGNDLGKLANINEIPVIDPAFDDSRLKEIIQYFSVNPDEMEREMHNYARQLLKEGKVKEAWQVLLAG